MIRRKMTEEDATILGLVPFIDYYEFSDNGTCLSLRDMSIIGNSDGTVSLSGRIHTNTSKLSRIVSVMFMGRTNMSRNIITTNIDGDVKNNSVENLLFETRKEYNERTKLGLTRKVCVQVSKRFYMTNLTIISACQTGRDRNQSNYNILIKIQT